MRWPRIDDRVRALSPKLLLFLLLFVALGLRLYGIAWDEGHGFHPDERSIYMRSDCMYNVLVKAPGYSGGDCITQNPEMEPGFPSIGAFLDADKSPLNPHWFPLGSLLIYLIVGIRLVLEPFLDLGSLASMSYIGRSITALADVGTVFIVYLLGKRIYDSRVGLLAAALVTFSVVHIQHAHFYRPEPLLVFFLATSFWFMLQVMERRRLRDSLLLGTFVGLTLATKVSVLPLVLPLILVYGFSLLTTPEARWTVPSRGASNRIVIHAFLAGGAALAGFLITTPYALLDIFNFASDIWWQATNVAKTAGKVPFTVQYVGTTPFLYELRQTSVWGLGLPLGVVAWGGLLFTIGYTISKVAKLGPVPRGKILLLAWVVPNVAMLSTFEVKFLRYIFPVIPFLVLMGSGTLVWMLDWARTLRPPSVPVAYSVDWTKRRLSKYAPHAVIGVIVFVVTATAFYAVAFERVYAGPHPAVQASRWINENIPNGATILSDTDWDEGIRDLHGYRVQRISIYHRPDDVEKMGTIATQLAGGHYLVFYSNRTYGSVARLPERYPLSSGYYRLLFSGQLGYTPEQVFTSYPRLMGVTFVDDTFTRAGIPKPESLKAFEPGSIALHLGYADENVINYDHPKVLLFRNEGRLSQAQLLDTLTTNLPEGGSQLGLMLGAEEKAVQRQGGTWSDIIKRDSWTNEVPVLAWLLLVELIYLTALPLSTFLFRPLPDRGIVLARVLGILGVSYVAWLLASLGCMGFSRASVLVGILVVALLSSIVLATRWREFKEFVSKNWRLLAIGEAIFLAAFLAFVAIRMANPDLWHSFRGGEKPMDFAYLNAVLRSTSMPPYDPWFAGGYLNYYYWGQFIVATLIKATGIVPSVAYNLAIPLLFALTVTGAYSLVYNIAAGVRRLSPASGLSLASSSSAEIDFASDQPYSRLETGGGYSPPYRQWRWWVHGVPWGPVIAGLLAGLFVAVIGNLDGIVQVVKGGWNSAIDGQAFPSLDYLSDFWRSSRMLPLIPEIAPSALTFWLDLSNPGVDRILENCPPNGPLDCGHHITEFPFFQLLVCRPSRPYDSDSVHYAGRWAWIQSDGGAFPQRRQLVARISHGDTSTSGWLPLGYKQLGLSNVLDPRSHIDSNWSIPVAGQAQREAWYISGTGTRLGSAELSGLPAISRELPPIPGGARCRQMANSSPQLSRNTRAVSIPDSDLSLVSIKGPAEGAPDRSCPSFGDDHGPLCVLGRPCGHFKRDKSCVLDNDSQRPGRITNHIPGSGRLLDWMSSYRHPLVYDLDGQRGVKQQRRERIVCDLAPGNDSLGPLYRHRCGVCQSNRRHWQDEYSFQILPRCVGTLRHGFGLHTVVPGLQRRPQAQGGLNREGRVAGHSDAAPCLQLHIPCTGNQAQACRQVQYSERDTGRCGFHEDGGTWRLGGAKAYRAALGLRCHQVATG